MTKYLSNIGPFTWLGLFFAAAAFIGVHFLERHQSRLSKDGALSTATIIEKFAERGSSGRGAKGLTYYFVRYRFVLPNGQKLETAKRMEPIDQDKFTVGDIVPVRYLPSSPTHNQINMSEYDEDAEAVGAIAWLLTVLSAIGLIMAAYRTLRSPSNPN